MLDLDLTKAINNLCEGKADEKEQKICGVVLKEFIVKKSMEQGMTRSEQKYQKAIKMLAEEYHKAIVQVSVRKPMAYALYQVWRYFDQHEKSRMTDEWRLDEIDLVEAEKEVKDE